MDTTTVEVGELEAVVELIAAEQVRLDRNIPYVGDDAIGIRAELDALEPPWPDTARASRAPDGSIVGASIVEWDASIGRAWVLGPWVFGDDEAWETHASQLLDAALAQLPDDVDVELSGEIANTRLATLAARRGFSRSGVSHVLTIDAEGVALWSATESRALRKGAVDDVETIRPLHDAEFPNTHTPVERVISELVTLIAETDDGLFKGYAAGRIQPDGEGYIDYVGVDPEARREGVGRALVTALTVELLDASPKGQVALSVNDDRVAARALYESLGFAHLVSMVGYRRTR